MTLPRTLRPFLVGVLVLPLAGLSGAVPTGSPAGDGQEFLLSLAPHQTSAASAAVRRSGGEVVQSYPDLDVLAVRTTGTAVQRLLAHPSVLGARSNSTVSVTSDAGLGGDRPAPLRNVYNETIRSPELAARGGTGEGVTVALIDTGVSPVPQLADRLVDVEGLDGEPASCVNFSATPTCADEYGHGTFMAGLITGAGPDHPGTSSARLLSLKLAGASGASDTSTLLAAMQWVVAHRDAYGVRVLNLSLGTPSGVSWRLDPLNYAVQKAVDAGIVVVVSAGNTGPDPRSVLKPGDDPLVLTVGASDDRGTADRGDDAVPLFSAQGPTRADSLLKPDVVAPGARLISLRSPGSTIEQNVPGGVDPAYRRGSGTSMATAVVSGAAAQLLTLHPGWSPAQVKAALMGTATPVAGQPVTVVGRGLVDVSAAADWSGSALQISERGVGTGSLSGSRGGHRVVLTSTGDSVEGEQTASGRSFDPVGYRSTGWAPGSWASSVFAATNWQATNWQATNWQATNWQATNWQATNWQSTELQATNWQGSTADPTAHYGRPGHGSAVLGAWE